MTRACRRDRGRHGRRGLRDRRRGGRDTGGQYRDRGGEDEDRFEAPLVLVEYLQDERLVLAVEADATLEERVRFAAVFDRVEEPAVVEAFGEPFEPPRQSLQERLQLIERQVGKDPRELRRFERRHVRHSTLVAIHQASGATRYGETLLHPEGLCAEVIGPP